jgi:hypothetical protein
MSKRYYNYRELVIKIENELVAEEIKRRAEIGSSYTGSVRTVKSLTKAERLAKQQLKGLSKILLEEFPSIEDETSSEIKAEDWEIETKK